MNIFQRFSHSLYDLKWLSERRKDGKSAAVYFFFLTFLVSLAFGVWFSFHLLGFWNETKFVLREQVPYFKAEMKDGSLSVTEMPQPFVKEGRDFKFIVDTATSSQTTINDFMSDNEKKAVVLISAREISIFNPGQNKIETTLFKDAPAFSTDKNEIVSGADRLQWLLFVVILLVMIVSYIGFAFANGFFLFFWSLIAWAAASIGKKDWKYLEVVSVGAFAMTAAVVVDTLLFVAGAKPPFLTAFIFLVYILPVIFSLNDGHIKKGEDKK